MKRTPEEVAKIQSNLAGFYGTERYHRLTFGPFVATDGVFYLAESCGAYWLLDAIVSWLGPLNAAGYDGPVFCKLTVNDGSAVLVGTDGNEGTKPLFKQEIEYTDFPLPEVEVWAMDGVLLLPSEY